MRYHADLLWSTDLSRELYMPGHDNMCLGADLYVIEHLPWFCDVPWHYDLQRHAHLQRDEHLSRIRDL